MTSALKALFLRDLRLAARIGGGGATGVAFFLALVTIAPFALGPDMNLLARIGPALLWIAALLATLIGLDRLFQADAEDGALDVMMESQTPLELLVLAKCAAHWVATGLPLALCAPAFGLMLALEGKALWGVTLSLLIGTPALTLIGAIGAALTASLRRGGLLMAILAIPFMAPTLIFGAASANAARGGAMRLETPLLALAALTLFALSCAPFAAAAALRSGRD